MKSIIKKELYKQKPTATRQGLSMMGYTQYNTTLNDGTVIVFQIPQEEVTDSFTDEMPAQLLIRWIDKLQF